MGLPSAFMLPTIPILLLHHLRSAVFCLLPLAKLINLNCCTQAVSALPQPLRA